MITAILPCRNSAWVLGLSVRALLLWVDRVIVLNHASTDGTERICAGLQREAGSFRFEYSTQHEETWREMAHRQGLLDLARASGTSHVVILDDDEILSSNLLPYIRGWVEGLNQHQILQLPWLSMGHNFSGWRYAVSGMWAEQFASSAFRDSTVLHWRAVDGYDHHHRHPMGRPLIPVRPVQHINGGVMHLQFASERRLLAKQALYQAIEMVRWPGRKPAAVVAQEYGRTVKEWQTARKAPVSDSWWEPYADLMHWLDVDAEPWQEPELRRLIEEHGRAKFAGLDFFGVA